MISQDNYWFPIQPAHTKPYIYGKYPRSQGVTLFSRVGFSKDGTMAVVTEGTMRAVLYGSGTVYLLKKEKGAWKIVKGEMTWIS